MTTVTSHQFGKTCEDFLKCIFDDSLHTKQSEVLVLRWALLLHAHMLWPPGSLRQGLTQYPRKTLNCGFCLSILSRWDDRPVALSLTSELPC